MVYLRSQLLDINVYSGDCDKKLEGGAARILRQDSNKRRFTTQQAVIIKVSHLSAGESVGLPFCFIMWFGCLHSASRSGQWKATVSE